MFDVSSVPLHIAGKVIANEPMSRHTSYRIGGPADLYAVPENVSELQALLKWALKADVPVFILGAGSNLLVSDKGIRGLVIKLDHGFDKIHVLGERAIAGGAVRLPVLVKRMVEESLSGLEGIAGIPGTVGGAVCMNAGTPFGCIGSALKSVRILDENADLRELPAEALELKYRESCVPQCRWIVVEATFEMHRGIPEKMRSEIEHILSKRKAAQPVECLTAGSVFKNPGDKFAGELLEKVGAKGMRIGDARVSEKHANFIENMGHATASNVRELVVSLQQKVKMEFGIDLEPEIAFVGEW